MVLTCSILIQVPVHRESLKKKQQMIISNKTANDQNQQGLPLHVSYEARRQRKLLQEQAASMANRLKRLQVCFLVN